jgi:hypothetical protein
MFFLTVGMAVVIFYSTPTSSLLVNYLCFANYGSNIVSKREPSCGQKIECGAMESGAYLISAINRYIARLASEYESRGV